jgi:hypothetical protein
MATLTSPLRGICDAKDQLAPKEEVGERLACTGTMGRSFAKSVPPRHGVSRICLLTSKFVSCGRISSVGPRGLVTFMADRSQALLKIAAGDIFHAEAANGASLICLALSVTESVIHARNVATQIAYDFDRQTGTAQWNVFSETYLCTIDSVAPLPPDIHSIMLDIDRKEMEHQKIPEMNKDGTFTAEERRGLLYVSYYYPAFPI